MTTTHTYSTSPLGRAPMPVPAGALAMVANHAHVPARALPAAASAGTSTTDAVTTHAATAATWLGGSGFVGDMGFGHFAVACDSQVSTNTTNATKRIHPGRLEGMT